ncbi:hypothetical protein STEG23_014634 [Scotinomys teguina]
MDAVYSTAILPKLLTDLVCDKKTISFTACLVQLFVEHLFGGAEVFILVVMAYDRYVAICKPLHYLTIMNRQLMDAVYSTAVSPKLLTDLICDKKTISFTACLVQLFVEHLFGGVEVFILMAMAYDRYVAIYKAFLDIRVWS